MKSNLGDPARILRDALLHRILGSGSSAGSECSTERRATGGCDLGGCDLGGCDLGASPRGWGRTRDRSLGLGMTRNPVGKSRGSFAVRMARPRTRSTGGVE